MEHETFTELPELQIRECPLTIQCPHCAFVYSDPEIKRLWSAYTRSKRTVFKPGPGRPRKYDHNEKCICGRPMHGPNGVYQLTCLCKNVLTVTVPPKVSNCPYCRRTIEIG